MKRVPFFYYIMACLLSICITACDKEEQLIEDEIPEMIKADLSKRYPSVEILNYQEYSNFSQINVIDKDQNEASISTSFRLKHKLFLKIPSIVLPNLKIYTKRSGRGWIEAFIHYISCISGKMLKI